MKKTKVIKDKIINIYATKKKNLNNINVTRHEKTFIVTMVEDNFI